MCPATSRDDLFWVRTTLLLQSLVRQAFDPRHAFKQPVQELDRIRRARVKAREERWIVDREAFAGSRQRVIVKVGGLVGIDPLRQLRKVIR